MVAFTPVRVPQELQQAKASVLEEYVQARLHQLVSALSQKLSLVYNNVTAEVVESSAAELARMLPPPRYDHIPLENMHLQLVFRHDCLALGCLDPQCILCQHNPQRRCTTNFDRKYLVNDALKAKCGAIIRVELIDRFTGNVVHEDVPDLKLEMNILDGNLYQTKFLEAGKVESANTEELNQCALLLDNKQQPLLVCGSGGTNDADGRVILSLQKGRAELPDLHIIRSSEALLSGRKPPFRLLVRAVIPSHQNLTIHHAVSEAFVVATRRTRTCGKADIPSIDDHVSKLEHMGRETVRKLYDLRTAAQAAGVQIDIPENCVQKVGEFKQLSLRAEQDGHLRQKLLHVLKLAKDKWDQTTEHAMKAVAADNHMRAWYTDPNTMETGLLYTCRLGVIDLTRPIGLLTRRVDNGVAKIEATLMPQQTPSQRETVRQLSSTALQSWYISGHPGWAMFPMDSEAYLQRGELVPSQPTDILPPVPQGVPQGTGTPTASNTQQPPSPRPAPTTPPVSDIDMTDAAPPPLPGPSLPAGNPAPRTLHLQPANPQAPQQGQKRPTPSTSPTLRADSEASAASAAPKAQVATAEVSPFANSGVQTNVAPVMGNIVRRPTPPATGPMLLVATLPPGTVLPTGADPAANPFISMKQAGAAGNPALNSVPTLDSFPTGSGWFNHSLLGSLAGIFHPPQQPNSQQPPSSAPTSAPMDTAPATTTAANATTNTSNPPSMNLSSVFSFGPGGAFGPGGLGPTTLLQSGEFEGAPWMHADSLNFEKGNSFMLFAPAGIKDHSMELAPSFGSGSGDSKGTDTAEDSPDVSAAPPAGAVGTT